MTLPKMKIYTGGDREYSERVQRALFELDVHWLVQPDQPKYCEQEWLVVGYMGRDILTHSLPDDGGHDLAAYRLASNGNLVPQEADDEGWIEWGGGECPVNHFTEVEVQLRNGFIFQDKAEELRWHPRDGLRIIGVVRYRVPSQIFPTSQRKPEPVHQMKHGDYILREDIPDEATFNAIVAEAHAQGTGWHTPSDWDSRFRWDCVFLDDENDWVWALKEGEKLRRRITPTELGITQEADMTPCEKKGLREGQWAWFKKGPAETGWKGCGWARLIEDDGTEQPRFIDGRGCPQWLYLKDIDWQAGIHNEKPDTEDSMSETLTEAEALREVAQGYEDGDENPWNRVQYLSAGGEWFAMGSSAEFEICMHHAASIRRKPRTVRIEGEIGEETVRRLRNLRTGDPGESLNAALDEILSTVQDQ